MTRRKFLLRLGELQAQADFNRQHHTYGGPDGTQLLGVTTTIRRAAEAGLLEWTPPPKSVYKPIHRQRGTAVHRATELHDRGTLNENTVDSRIQGFVDAWESFAQIWGYDWDAIETPIACPKLGYAGTPDRLKLGDVGRYRGRVIVLDIKTGKSPRSPRGWELQTMAYARLFGEAAAMRAIRLAVLLHEDGRFHVEQRPDHWAAKDLRDWLQCLKNRG